MLRCRSPGLRSSVQDAGRPGLAHLGVPHAGAADPLALAAANLLCGNEPGAPVLEMTLLGASFAVLAPVLVALTGADMEAHVPEQHRCLSSGAGHLLQPGTTLVLGGAQDGARTYLALAGGIRADLVLGSASTDPVGGFGGLGGRPLAEGDLLVPAAIGSVSPKPLRWPGPGPSSGVGRHDGPHTAVVLPGPHHGAFPADVPEALVSVTWTVSARSDRAGLRLEGPPLARGAVVDPVSLPMIRGAVQVPPGGLPIVLGPDGPTVGGYPVPACVIEADFPVLGQLRPGDRLLLRWTDPATARERLRAREAQLAAAARALGA